MRALSGLFFVLALAALAVLLASDLWTRFQATHRHVQAEALALIFVGTSFICLQFSAGRNWREAVNGLLLGLAFVLWGAEQFLPQGPAVTATDCVVITIFIVDLGLVIGSRLGRSAHQTSTGVAPK